jgi:hypothetical protein
MAIKLDAIPPLDAAVPAGPSAELVAEAEARFSAAPPWRLLVDERPGRSCWVSADLVQVEYLPLRTALQLAEALPQFGHRVRRGDAPHPAPEPQPAPRMMRATAPPPAPPRPKRSKPAPATAPLPEPTTDETPAPPAEETIMPLHHRDVVRLDRPWNSFTELTAATGVPVHVWQSAKDKLGAEMRKSPGIRSRWEIPATDALVDFLADRGINAHLAVPEPVGADDQAAAADAVPADEPPVDVAGDGPQGAPAEIVGADEWDEGPPPATVAIAAEIRGDGEPATDVAPTLPQDAPEAEAVRYAATEPGEPLEATVVTTGATEPRAYTHHQVYTGPELPGCLTDVHLGPDATPVDLPDIYDVELAERAEEPAPLGMFDDDSILENGIQFGLLSRDGFLRTGPEPTPEPADPRSDWERVTLALYPVRPMTVDEVARASGLELEATLRVLGRMVQLREVALVQADEREDRYILGTYEEAYEPLPEPTPAPLSPSDADLVRRVVERVQGAPPATVDEEEPECYTLHIQRGPLGAAATHAAGYVAATILGNSQAAADALAFFAIAERDMRREINETNHRLHQLREGLERARLQVYGPGDDRIPATFREAMTRPSWWRRLLGLA